MIVAEQGDQLRLVTQPDHAILAWDLLRLWVLDGLPDHPRRGELLLAVREHDNGWQEADSAPRVARDGRPLDFIHLPTPDRLRLWEKGIERAEDLGPWAGLLVLEHAVRLHESRGEPPWPETVEAWRRRREEGSEALGLDRSELIADYGFLALADTLSLAVCSAWEGARSVDGSPTRFEVRGGELALAPFPLKGRTRFRVPARWIENRGYRSDPELGIALATARWSAFEVRVVPL